jgi:hypothetical protein
MITNVLPEWLPFINFGSSLILVLFVLLLLLIGKQERRWTYAVLLLLGIIILGGAAFQANLIGVGVWTIIGTGGRILTFLMMLVTFIHDF